MDDPEVAAKALSAGLDAASCRLFAGRHVKAKLIENTQWRRGVRITDILRRQEMFFGKEQLREVEEMVAGG